MLRSMVWLASFFFVFESRGYAADCSTELEQIKSILSLQQAQIASLKQALGSGLPPGGPGGEPTDPGTGAGLPGDVDEQLCDSRYSDFWIVGNCYSCVDLSQEAKRKACVLGCVDPLVGLTNTSVNNRKSKECRQRCNLNIDKCKIES